jgi:transcriptional regulator with GAF, ATPase, and Fis domain
MRALRHKIELVAATDFTVLMEGGTGPEAHHPVGVFV